MDNWLKGLVAAACAVIIAGGGWYLYGEYLAHKAAGERAARLEGARSELFELADAKAHEAEKVRNYCDMLNRVNTNNSEKSEMREQVLRNCRYFGYL